MDYYLEVCSNIGIYAILALALNVVCGLTGLLHLGQAGFFCVGAYAAGMVAAHAWVPALGAANLLCTAGAAMLAAAVFALLIGLPCLRLKGDYLAIATLGFGEVLRLTVENLDALGGATGLRLPSAAKCIHWWQIWLLVGLTWLLLVNLKRSAIGRALQAIREDEIAARAMGVNVPLYKSGAFVICAVFAGLAGALFAHKVGYFAPKKFDLMLSIDVLLIVVLGGLGSLTGSLLAAIALVVLREVLGGLPTVTLPWPGGGLAIDPGQHRELFYAVLLVVLIRFVPHGLLGLHETPAWWPGGRARAGQEAPHA